MRLLGDEFSAFHSDMRGYRQVDSVEFELTILTHFLDRPDWLNENVPIGISRAWALDQILSKYLAPKQSTTSLLWTSFKQWVCRMLNKPVRLTQVQKEYFKMLIGLTTGIHRRVIYVNTREEMLVVASFVENGIYLMENYKTPLMIMPIETTNKTPNDEANFMTESIYILDSEVVTGGDIRSFCDSVLQSIEESNKSSEEKA